jgi:FeS assembly SUF system regulator
LQATKIEGCRQMRLTKLTDYGIAILAFMASRPNLLFVSADVASQTAIPGPTVAKLLKLMTKSGLLLSRRGVKGGYCLAAHPEATSLATIIQALEGPISLTQCVTSAAGCEISAHCRMQTPWLRLNDLMTQWLTAVFLSDLIASPALAASHKENENHFIAGSQKPRFEQYESKANYLKEPYV